jgi:hypothetical protein
MSLPDHLDGRRNRPSANEVPLNVDVPPNVKELAVKAAAELGMPIKVFVAKAIEHYYQHARNGGRQDVAKRLEETQRRLSQIRQIAAGE